MVHDRGGDVGRSYFLKASRLNSERKHAIIAAGRSARIAKPLHPGPP